MLVIRPRVGQVLGLYHNNVFLGTIDVVQSKTGRGIALVANLPPSVGIDKNYKRYVAPDPPRTFGDFEPEDCPYVPYDADNY